MIFSALTVAGSDPSGGAGIQADLKTFAGCGVYGFSAITALTAQDTTGVSGVMQVPAVFIAQQLDAIFSDVHIEAAKTGMLGNAGAIETIAEQFQSRGLRNIVVDPVMRSTSGSLLMESGAIEILQRRLIPLATLVTPNLDEARVLSGVEIEDQSGMEAAARRIRSMGTQFVLVKGGHLAGDAVDILYDGTEFLRLRTTRIGNDEVHGTGCVLSAAITAFLAQGSPMNDAVQRGKEVVTRAIATAVRIGRGSRVITSVI